MKLLKLEHLINSPEGLRLAVFLARSVPPRAGYACACLAARVIAARPSSALVRAVRANQQMVGWTDTGREVDEAALDERVLRTFEQMGRSLYDLYHYMANPQLASGLFVFDPTVQELLGRAEFASRGLLVAGLHMSSFDLALQYICMFHGKPLVLTIPNPQGGRRMEFEIRKRTGMNLVPATASGVRQAVRHLERGGLVGTGIDWPLPDTQLMPCFFGRPACLPVHYIHMALRARVPVMVMMARYQPDGKYHIIGSPTIEMDAYPTREEEIRRNAEKVLAVAEEFVRQTPQQWAISQPVWPEEVGFE